MAFFAKKVRFCLEKNNFFQMNIGHTVKKGPKNLETFKVFCTRLFLAALLIRSLLHWSSYWPLNTQGRGTRGPQLGQEEEPEGQDSVRTLLSGLFSITLLLRLNLRRLHPLISDGNQCDLYFSIHVSPLISELLFSRG